MEINICHLYPDLLNVYGDLGNILILKHRCESRGIQVNVKNISLGDPFNKDEHDIVFFGGGQDYEQSIVSPDLMGEKREALKDYIEEGKVLLAICGGYQLLGKYYTAPNGEKLDGLDILDLYTVGGDNRFIGNTIIENEVFNETYVGFENHSGRTYLGEGLSPLGKCVIGYGNNGEDGAEGCIYKNTFGSYFHGPILTKNPEFADRLIKTALLNKGEDFELAPLDDTFEVKAKESIINTLKNKPA